MHRHEYDDDTTLRDYSAWQRWQRDHTPIEYWHSLDLTYQAYVEACAEAEEAEDDDANP